MYTYLEEQLRQLQLLSTGLTFEEPATKANNKLPTFNKENFLATFQEKFPSISIDQAKFNALSYNGLECFFSNLIYYCEIQKKDASNAAVNFFLSLNLIYAANITKLMRNLGKLELLNSEITKYIAELILNDNQKNKIFLYADFTDQILRHPSDLTSSQKELALSLTENEINHLLVLRPESFSELNNAVDTEIPDAVTSDTRKNLFDRVLACKDEEFISKLKIFITLKEIDPIIENTINIVNEIVEHAKPEWLNHENPHYKLVVFFLANMCRYDLFEPVITQKDYDIIDILEDLMTLNVTFNFKELNRLIFNDDTVTSNPESVKSYYYITACNNLLESKNIKKRFTFKEGNFEFYKKRWCIFSYLAENNLLTQEILIKFNSEEDLEDLENLYKFAYRSNSHEVAIAELANFATVFTAEEIKHLANLAQYYAHSLSAETSAALILFPDMLQLFKIAANLNIGHPNRLLIVKAIQQSIENHLTQKKSQYEIHINWLNKKAALIIQFLNKAIINQNLDPSFLGLLAGILRIDENFDFDFSELNSLLEKHQDSESIKKAFYTSAINNVLKKYKLNPIPFNSRQDLNAYIEYWEVLQVLADHVLLEDLANNDYNQAILFFKNKMSLLKKYAPLLLNSDLSIAEKQLALTLSEQEIFILSNLDKRNFPRLTRILLIAKKQNIQDYTVRIGIAKTIGKIFEKNNTGKDFFQLLLHDQEKLENIILVLNQAYLHACMKRVTNLLTDLMALDITLDYECLKKTLKPCIATMYLSAFYVVAMNSLISTKLPHSSFKKNLDFQLEPDDYVNQWNILKILAMTNMLQEPHVKIVTEQASHHELQSYAIILKCLEKFNLIESDKINALFKLNKNNLIEIYEYIKNFQKNKTLNKEVLSNLFDTNISPEVYDFFTAKPLTGSCIPNTMQIKTDKSYEINTTSAIKTLASDITTKEANKTIRINSEKIAILNCIENARALRRLYGKQVTLHLPYNLKQLNLLKNSSLPLSIIGNTKSEITQPLNLAFGANIIFKENTSWQIFNDYIKQQTGAKNSVLLKMAQEITRAHHCGVLNFHDFNHTMINGDSITFFDPNIKTQQSCSTKENINQLYNADIQRFAAFINTTLDQSPTNLAKIIDEIATKIAGYSKDIPTANMKARYIQFIETFFEKLSDNNKKKDYLQYLLTKKNTHFLFAERHLHYRLFATTHSTQVKSFALLVNKLGCITTSNNTANSITAEIGNKTITFERHAKLLSSSHR